VIDKALHRSTLTLCILFLALSASVWLRAQDDASNTTSQAQTYPVRGTVINSVTHEPVARALVTFAGESPSSMLTDSEGRFEFPNVPAGRSVLQARRPGFFARGSGQDMYQPISVGPKNEDIVLTLEPAGSITGRVTLSTSDPADNIHVQLMRRTIQEGRARWQAVEMKSTNSEGVFRFGNLQKGEYRLYTANSIDPDAGGQSRASTRSGFPPVWYPEESDGNTTGILRLGAGQQLSAELALSRESFYSVTIPVANNPGMGISFQVLDQNGRIFDSGVSYDTRRQQLRTYLPSGNYILTGQSYAPAFGFGSVQISVRDTPVRGQPLTVLPTHPIPVTIRKEFTNPENESPQVTMIENGVQVEISRDINIMLFSTTDNDALGVNLRRERGNTDDSAWVLENVLPGKYWVLTYANQGYVASITAGGTDLSREPLVVGPGGTSAPINIMLRNDTATLSVRLKDAPAMTADASPRAFFYLLPQFDLTSVVPESGPLVQTSQISNLQPGTYRVIALDQAFDLEYRNPKALEPFAGKGQTITLEPGGTANVDLDVVSTETAMQ
jgi:hypothetical protein